MSIVEPHKPLTLDEELDRLVSMGLTDPLEGAKKLAEIHGEHWVASQLLLYQEDILSDMLRRRLGSVRRKAEVALRPGDEMSQVEMRIAKAWVPGFGWKRAADLTISDLKKRAEYYFTLANAADIRARWNLEVVGLMEAEGAKTLGKLKAPLPALPGDDEVREIAA